MSTPKKQPRKHRLSKDAIEYQPDAVEISMRPLPWWARYGILWGLLFFIAAIIAAIICRVDIIVDGTGKLVAYDSNIVMKPLDRSIIKDIHVKVGDIVEKDQLLISFDPTINEKELVRLEGEFASVEAQYERWKAEAEKREYKVDDKPTLDQEKQSMIFKERAAHYKERMKGYDETLNSYKISIADTENKIKRRSETLEKQEKIATEYEKLHNQGAITLKEYTDAFNQANSTRTEIETLESTILDLNSKIAKDKAERGTFMTEWAKDTAEQYVRAELERDKIKNSLEKVHQLTTYTEMRAQRRAIVHEIAPFPKGSAVREAEALITLIPLDCDIELEARIRASDIGQIRAGLPVRIKLNAFPFQKHGTLSGIIRIISEDTFKPDQGERGSDYYRVNITITDTTLRQVPDTFRLIPGMEGQAEVKVGRRRVIEYVIHPLIKAFDEAIREK